MAKKWAVVTGGARNIGQAIGRRLLADGFRVITLDIVTPQDFALQADSRPVDLSDRKATEAALNDVAALPISVLVSNMGAGAGSRRDYGQSRGARADRHKRILGQQSARGRLYP